MYELAQIKVCFSVLCALCIMVAQPFKAEAYLEPIVAEEDDYGNFNVNGEILRNDNLCYEFDLTSDLYVKSTDNTGMYQEVDMSCRVAIGADGKIVYVFYAQEDVDVVSNVSYGITMNTPRLLISYELPEWYRYDIFREKTSCLVTGSLSNCVTHYNIRSDRKTDYSCQPSKTFTQFIWSVMVMPVDEEPPRPSISFKKGDVLGVYVFYPSSTIYTDESGNSFVKNADGSKNYFHDTISVTINNVTLSKEIGNGWADSNALVYRQGDVNGDDEFSVADVVLLQKWLLTETKELPCWQAADLYKDERLDVFDLCLMKRKLLEKLN